MNQPTFALCWLAAAAALGTLAFPAHAIDSAAAEKLINDNKCVKCHAVDRKKDGPAYRDVAAKFRAEADAESKIVHHVTAGDLVKFPDGHEERHKKVKVASPAELDNLVHWILSLEGGTKY
jgi:cytochrome c